MARQIIVEIVGDAKKFSGTLTEATGKAEGFRSKLTGIGKGMAIGAGVASFNLLQNAISLGVSKLDEMHQAYLDDQAGQVRLQNTLKNTVANYEDATKAAEEFAGAQVELGFADDDVRESLGQLVGMTHDLDEAQKLVTLSMDLARAKNIDLAKATDVITKAYNGQGRGLVALGINIQGAVGRTELLARALQNVRGSAQAYATTGAGRVAAANVKMGETMEKVGEVIDKVSQIVIPIMVDGLSELVDIVGDVIGVLADWAGWLDRNVSPALQNAARNAATLVGWVQTLASLIPSIPAFPNLFGGGGGTGAQGLAGKIPGLGGTGGVTISHGINIGVPIQSKHSGGIVSGPMGSDQLVLARAGENVQTKGQQGGQTIIVNIASFIGSDRDIDRFSDRLAFRLRSTSLS